MEESGMLQSLLDFVAGHQDGLGALVFFFSSLIEYVFPPFPGDMVTLFGTWLVVLGHWRFEVALGLVTAGSLSGAAIGYGIGIWLGRRLERLPSEGDKTGFRFLTKEKYELLNEKFKKHGAFYILINRFLPGVRAFFFVAAGASRMSFWKVMGFAFLSALAWNVMLLLVGVSVGKNWDRMQSVMAHYTLGIWLLLGGLFATVILVWAIKKRQAR